MDLKYALWDFRGIVLCLVHANTAPFCSPYKFEAPWHTFEFAFHILAVEANLVIITMAWVTREDGRHFSRMPAEPDMETLTYWYVFQSHSPTSTFPIFVEAPCTDGTIILNPPPPDLRPSSMTVSNILSVHQGPALRAPHPG